MENSVFFLIKKHSTVYSYRQAVRLTKVLDSQTGKIRIKLAKYKFTTEIGTEYFVSFEFDLVLNRYTVKFEKIGISSNNRNILRVMLTIASIIAKIVKIRKFEIDNFQIEFQDNLNSDNFDHTDLYQLIAYRIVDRTQNSYKLLKVTDRGFILEKICNHEIR